jgi:hypothetical protein
MMRVIPKGQDQWPIIPAAERLAVLINASQLNIFIYPAIGTSLKEEKQK